MPVHDWTKVDAGLFHAFHQLWISSLCESLNGGALPGGYFALPEQRVEGPIPDLLTLELAQAVIGDDASQGVAVLDSPPRTRVIQRSEADLYAAKADRVSVRHRHGEVVSVIEIVSPGNKGSTAQFRAFVQKSAELIRRGVNLLAVDLLPPGRRDPQGIHAAVWDEFSEDDFSLPADKRLTLASYDAGPEKVAYVEPVAVGDTLPDMPIFLRPGYYANAPLERSYLAAWRTFPDALKPLLG